MNTENTDAATRILTKTIRKLTEQLASADASISYEADKRREVEDELTAVRSKLAGASKPAAVVWGGSHFLQWNATPAKTVGQLAEDRMAELAKERDSRKHAEEGRRLAGDRMVDLEERIEKALGSLEGAGSAVARVHAARRILRGEA